MKILIGITTVNSVKHAKKIKDCIDYLLLQKPEDSVEAIVVLDDYSGNEFIIRNVGDQGCSGAFTFFTIKEQEAFVQKFFPVTGTGAVFMKEKLPDILPVKNVNRRNFCVIYAMGKDFDCFVSTDDDNYPLNETWLFDLIYNNTGEKNTTKYGSSNWLDIFNSSIVTDKRFYAHTKGYLYRPKALDRDINENNTDGELVAYQGYSLGEPDRTALDRYLMPDIDITEEDIKMDSNHWFNTKWLPINTQNTVFYKKCFPTLFLFPIESKLFVTSKISRIGDNLMGYFLQKISHYFGDYVGFGRPFNRQKRIGYHYLHTDLVKEWLGTLLMEVFIDYLFKITVKGDDYLSAYDSIIKQLVSKTIMGTTAEDHFVFNQVKAASFWVELVKQVYTIRDKKPI